MPFSQKAISLSTNYTAYPTACKSKINMGKKERRGKGKVKRKKGKGC